MPELELAVCKGVDRRFSRTDDGASVGLNAIQDTNRITNFAEGLVSLCQSCRDACFC
jgi:hypothetical protein